MGKPRESPDDLVLRLGWRQPAYAGAPRGRDNCLSAALKRLGRAFGFIVIEIRDAEPVPPPLDFANAVAPCPACAEAMEFVDDARCWRCCACGRWFAAPAQEAPS